MPHFFHVFRLLPGFCITREECVRFLVGWSTYTIYHTIRRASPDGPLGGVINAHQALRLRWQLTFTMLLKRNQVVSGKKPTWLANYTPNYAKVFSARLSGGKFPRPQAVSSLKTIRKSGEKWRKGVVSAGKIHSHWLILGDPFD